MSLLCIYQFILNNAIVVNNIFIIVDAATAIKLFLAAVKQRGKKVPCTTMKHKQIIEFVRKALPSTHPLLVDNVLHEAMLSSLSNDIASSKCDAFREYLCNFTYSLSHQQMRIESSFSQYNRLCKPNLSLKRKSAKHRNYANVISEQRDYIGARYLHYVGIPILLHKLTIFFQKKQHNVI